MKPICSNKHFERLLKSFRKIAINQINNNHYLSIDEINVLNTLFNRPVLEPTFDFLSKEILNRFKKNPRKSHSCYDDVLYHKLVNKIWVSYTLVNLTTKQRQNHYINAGIVFKIYIKLGQKRKKRVVRWIIPIDWHNN